MKRKKDDIIQSISLDMAPPILKDFYQSGKVVTYEQGRDGQSITTIRHSFDSLCDEARHLNDKRGKLTWQLGDLLLTCLGEGLGSITDVAKHIGEDERRLQSYAQLATFYPADVRTQFEWCTYTHFRYACQFAGEDVDTAIGYLNHAEETLATCAEFYKWLKEQAGTLTPTTKTRAELEAENGELREIIGDVVAFLEDETMGLYPDKHSLLERAKAVLGRE